ncbi:hypothetical protein EDD18DRAFT_1100569 [Armillaria luteobubalina]|uniref:Uncharacterized protein n=1 Tax=Armillaria luteobubalina TaxID=153913 RepID=A0AA39QGV5_9AGAR|nr:hypothetical protein EDD18DRAFT_1100569 [Armillaria luteobubalina]
MLFAIFKFIKLVFYVFVVLGPAHYYLLFLSKDQSTKNVIINLFSYTLMWMIALGEVDFGHRRRPDGQTGLVVLALRWWIRDTIAATFLGVVIAVLLRNLTYTSSSPEIHSPLLPGFFDALSCANHSCVNLGEVEPSSYRTVSAVLTDVAERAREADDALNDLLLKLPSAVATMDVEISERRHHPISVLDISRMIASMFELIQLNPAGSLHNSFLYVISFIVDHIEIMIRRNDFMMGDAVPREFSPSMLMALGGWNVLVMDTRVALVSLDRVLNKLSDDFDLTLLVQRSIIHAERNVHLTHILSSLDETLGKLDAVELCLEALQPVEAFRDQARRHGGELRLELHGLLKTMEHIPRRATSKILVCTKGEMSDLREKVERVKQGIIVDGRDNSVAFLIKNTQFAVMSNARVRRGRVKYTDPSKRNIRIKRFLEVSAYQAFVDRHQRGNGWQGRKKVLHTNISQLESGLVYWDGRIEIHFYGLICRDVASVSSLTSKYDVQAEKPTLTQADHLETCFSGHMLEVLPISIFRKWPITKHGIIYRHSKLSPIREDRRQV